MSSKVAAYFPDALTSTSEPSEPAWGEPEIAVHPPNRVQSQNEILERPAGNASQTAETSDEMLLGQVRQGSKEALALLFRRHARTVRNVAHRILRNEAEADDLVQEVFLFIFRKASLFDASQGAARSWIVQVTYSRGFDRLRYLNSRHYYTSEELEDTGLHLADRRREIPFHERSMEGILGRELTARVNFRLSPQQRETIQLYFFEGYTLQEIAQRRGQSLANVRHQYYRGLERLRRYVLPEKLRSK
jgi:RNA polymerase sigma-70 factor (ECF subfamily)